MLEELGALIGSLPQLDMFFHDSDHSYRHQTAELRLAAARMADAGLVVCDDSDSSFAFLDFCRERRVPGRFLFDGKRFLGATSLSSQES
jgi:hypothetical protein